MEKQFISFDNYEQIISKLQINTFPKLLQNGHRFFMEAKDFYDQEPTIRETIDIYLDRLNTYLSEDGDSINQVSIIEIDFIKRFLEMHRAIQSKEQLKTYIFDLHSAISKKLITKNSPIADQVDQIQKKLINLYNDRLFENEMRIVIKQKWLNELRKITNSKVSNISKDQELGVIENLPQIKPNKASGLFSAMNEHTHVKNANTFTLNGDLGVLLGNIERFELAITIEGDQGGGKTRFTYQLADAFADIGNKIAIFSLEIGSKSDLITRMKKEYLQPENQHKIFIADQIPEGHKTIQEATKSFDVIIIDSWNKTGLPSQDFDKLRKENTNTIFIVIFQRTTQKTIRGGTAPLFDAGINIEVVKADDSFRNNYAVTSKNRYGITGIKYNIFNKEIMGAAEMA